MTRAIHRPLRPATMVAVLVVAVLPYASWRCVDLPGGCPMSSAASEGPSHGVPASRTSCCAVTARCAIEPTPATDAAAALEALTSIEVPWLPTLLERLRAAEMPREVVHGPPPFIRFCALLR